MNNAKKRENNRMGKPRDLFKKIRDTKGNFHAKLGTIKDRNGMDLTEAEDIKKRWQEYAEELYKKDLHDPDNHDGVINKAEVDAFLELSCFLNQRSSCQHPLDHRKSKIGPEKQCQRMFKILSIILLACEMSAIVT